MIRTDDLRAAAAARRAAFQDKTERRWGGGVDTDRFHARSAETMGAGTAQRRGVSFPAQWRAQTVQRDGRDYYEVSGYATTWNQKYEMWDMFGPYEESVEKGAATATLAAKPDVVFLINHTGLALARTINGSLILGEDDHGMADTAYLNPERQDARDLVAAIEDGVITEQSFAFRIDEGWWNDDFTEFKIMQFDINRGDTSAVNYGANPTTDIAARQAALLRDLRRAPQHIQRAAEAALHEKPAGDAIIDRVLDQVIERAEAEVPKGMSLDRARMLLDLWEAEQQSV